MVLRSAATLNAALRVNVAGKMPISSAACSTDCHSVSENLMDRGERRSEVLSADVSFGYAHLSASIPAMGVPSPWVISDTVVLRGIGMPILTMSGKAMCRVLRGEHAETIACLGERSCIELRWSFNRHIFRRLRACFNEIRSFQRPCHKTCLTAAYWSVAVTAHVIGFSVLHHRCVGCDFKAPQGVEM